MTAMPSNRAGLWAFLTYGGFVFVAFAFLVAHQTPFALALFFLGGIFGGVLGLRARASSWGKATIAVIVLTTAAACLLFFSAHQVATHD
jgi:hypothetical protein